MTIVNYDTPSYSFLHKNKNLKPLLKHRYKHNAASQLQTLNHFHLYMFQQLWLITKDTYKHILFDKRQ